jgi:tetratricopeptide (TPR) repeat protein
MFGFLKRLFGKNSQLPVDPEEIVEEFWLADFARSKTARFCEESGDSYTASFSDNSLQLHLKRRNLFAWTVNPRYRYRDFVLEALFEFPENRSENSADTTDTAAGTAAAGILFRLISDSIFYSVQISDRGFIRLDAVVNNTPLPVLGWTETERSSRQPLTDKNEEIPPYLESDRVYSLRIIAHDTSITLIVNDVWVAECSDDTIQAPGKLAFAAQTWDSCPQATISLNALSVESRSMEVETLYTRWNQYLHIPEQARIRLAETWYAMGQYVPAFLELRKIWKKRQPQHDELLLAGQIHLAQRLYQSAGDFFNKALEQNPASPEVHAEIAGLYYLENRWGDLEKHLETMDRHVIQESAFLSSLEGHLLAWKGDHSSAAQAYYRAGTINRGQGLFFFNAGKEWHLADENTKAAKALKEAAHLFLNNGEYDDLDQCLALLAETKKDDPELPALTGKYLYATGDMEKARDQLAEAVRKRTKDSAVWYLHAMILQSDGMTDKAVKAVEKAIQLEPEYGLYRFRLAEMKFNAGASCTDELQIALEKDPDNGWVHNLAALVSLRDGDTDGALRAITRARSILPRELPVLINYAEIERRRGNLDSVLPLLSGEDPETLHAAANLLVEDERLDEADEWYRRALHRRPHDPEILTDCAANCLERDLINEADDLLARAFEGASNERMYQLVSVLAGKKGEYARAEVALLQGLQEFPENPTLLYELSGVYLVTGKLDKARSLAERLVKAGRTDKAEALLKEIQDAGTNKIHCSVCGREWRVPRDIPPQGSLRLRAQPPDDLPAGTCPECRKTYCIACAKEHLGDDGRFRCRDCGVPLKLVDQNVLWLLDTWHKEALKKITKND